MKFRSAVVMAAWLALVGCDDEDDKKQAQGGEVVVTLDKSGGCDEDTDTGTAQKDGRQGKVTIKWDRTVPAAVLTIALSFTLLARRRTWTA